MPVRPGKEYRWRSIMCGVNGMLILCGSKSVEARGRWTLLYLCSNSATRIRVGSFSGMLLGMIPSIINGLVAEL